MDGDDTDRDGPARADEPDAAPASSPDEAGPANVGRGDASSEPVDGPVLPRNALVSAGPVADPTSSDESGDDATIPATRLVQRVLGPDRLSRLASLGFLGRRIRNWALLVALIFTLLFALLGALPTFVIMAADVRFPFSVPVALLSCLASVIGALWAAGAFWVRPADEPSATTTLRALAPRLIELAAGVVVLVASLRLAVAGSLPKPVLSAAVLITGSFLWTVISTFRLGQALGGWQVDETGAPRSLWRREGFWLIVLGTVLYLPLLGSYSLSDPWEAHYGEVAREMLSRDDWISLWWAQDGWFWSKPILNFWMQGLCFSLLGVRYMPDEFLEAAAHGRFPQPEWAARLPVFILTMAGVYFLYKGVARGFGRKAGLLGGIALLTMPYWYLIAHQSMTDMPYVGPMAAGMGLILWGLHTDPEARVSSVEIGVGKWRVRVSLKHLVLGVVLLTVLPQVLYLATRNLTLQIRATPHGFLPHLDRFFSGSGEGNCGLPGNEACRGNLEPLHRDFQPYHGAILWTVIAAVLTVFNRAEDRAQRLLFLAGWYFIAISCMGKGAPGLVLPLFTVGIYVGATRRWTDLARLELPAFFLMFLCVVLPWYFAMYMRHGEPFTDRLLFHDMYKRAFVHVHDTNQGDDLSFRYYIWQLGYGLFPWTGLAAGGLVWWLRRRDAEQSRQSDAGAFLFLWFIASFAMFTITLTKFHHYILPVVPPTAALLGVMLAHALDDAELPEPKRLAGYFGGTGAAMALLLYGVLRLRPGSLLGTMADSKPLPAQVWLGAGCILAGVVAAAFVALRFGRKAARRATPGDTDEADAPVASAMLGAIGIASAIVVALAGRDMFTTIKGDIDGPARLMHLFTYNYRRPWADTLDFNGVLMAFTVVSAALCLLLAIAKWRTHVLSMLLTLSVLWTAWGIDVYLYRSSPHWGQRETVMAYYADRRSAEEPFVAYQMNWKGENIYTGNKVPAFVASGQKFKDWIDEQKKKGVKRMYFTTEHGRVASLKSELGNPAHFDELTTKQLNNKFFLARVEW